MLRVHDVTKALDLVLLQQLLHGSEAILQSVCVIWSQEETTLFDGILTLCGTDGTNDGDASASLQLRHELQQFRVVDVQSLVLALALQLCFGHDQHLGSPVLRVRLDVHFHQDVARQLELHSLETITPLHCVGVVGGICHHHRAEDDGQSGLQDVHEEHHQDALNGSEQGDRPVVVLPSRTPIWILDCFRNGARGVDTSVAHQEEHGQDGGDSVQLTDGDGTGAENAAGEQSQARLLARGRRKVPEDWQGLVRSDGREKTGAGSQTRETGADGRSHDSVDDHLLERPGGARSEELVVQKRLSWGDTTEQDDEGQVDEGCGQLRKQGALRNGRTWILEVSRAIATGHDTSVCREPKTHHAHEVVLRSVVGISLLRGRPSWSPIVAKVAADACEATPLHHHRRDASIGGGQIDLVGGI
mmetsp:Transcript_11086/g.24431  ORF Transcript_11086/g.24431 Transcript_11086/m.24431 type:complete len:416 (+) Transcript_11086:1310-2557(+)